jgi:hypothetical protein
MKNNRKVMAFTDREAELFNLLLKDAEVVDVNKEVTSERTIQQQIYEKIIRFTDIEDISIVNGDLHLDKNWAEFHPALNEEEREWIRNKCERIYVVSGRGIN